MKFSKKHWELRHRGLVPGLPVPSPRALVDGPSIDRQICAESTCAACGHHGLRYEPYRGQVDGSQYVALAVCPQPDCQEAEEF
jgi:hypothetical protein